MENGGRPTIDLPGDFKDWAKGFFKEEFPDFIAAIDSPPTLSVRLNPEKWPTAPFPGDPVPWHSNAWYLEERPNFSQDPRWHGGAYYVQDASSMLIAQCIQQIQLPESPLLLDLCGAPGGKATLLIDSMPHDAILLANEVIKTRFPILLENLERWGDSRVFATQADPSRLTALGPIFDLVLVDAPCSGEGLFRKDPQARDQWSADHVQHCSLRQSRILDEADQCLAPGGYLIYSTCTFNEKENFSPILDLLNKKGYDTVTIELDTSWGVKQLTHAAATGYACYPHRVKGEGFFFTILKKKGTAQDKIKNKRSPILTKNPWPSDWMPKGEHTVWQRNDELCTIPVASLPAFEKISTHITRFVPVGRLGKIKGKNPVPDHTLAQMRQTEHLPGIDLELEAALNYLRKTDQNYESPQGWHIVRYQGLGLGWIKRLDKRSNNYYPTSYRLRN